MTLPKDRLGRILFVAEPHRPYHDKRAWKLMLAAAAAFKPDVVVTMGDFADFYTVSAHSKDPLRALKLDWELDDVKVGLAELKSLKASTYIYLGGNHEDRLRRYVQDKAPELGNKLTVERLLGLTENGWQYVPYRSDIRLGKLYLTHDTGKAGRYAVFQNADTYQHSVVTGHTHRLAYTVEGDATGKSKLSASFGWLGDAAKADYMHSIKARRDWALGFGVGYHDPKTQAVHVVPVPIIGYRCVVEGRLYSI